MFKYGLTECYTPAGHGVPVIWDVEKLSEVVGSTDQRQLDEEVIEQKHPETFPLLLPGLWLVLYTQTHNVSIHCIYWNLKQNKTLHHKSQLTCWILYFCMKGKNWKRNPGRQNRK